MNRKSIPANIGRKLWAQCGGYCQNPTCNRYLFADIEDDSVSLANIAHIIGAGKTGPRTEHEIAEFIDKNGYDNLIMLCLDCHKIVDELEGRFSVEKMQTWKIEHSERIALNFIIPNINNEKDLLIEISYLLDENKAIFEEYGPFSMKALGGDSGDAQKVWRRRCLDTILPNNKRIIDLVEMNKRNFSYPWPLYSKMLEYKIHVDSFRENCLFDERVNDYKLFPTEFSDYVKTSLGISIENRETRIQEEIEYRRDTISEYIRRFLSSHSHIVAMEEWNRAIFQVLLYDGRNIRVFVTNTYHFTEYTFEKIMIVDPAIDAIICSNPYSTYSDDAKKQCIQNNVGLFKLNEFMGAIRMEGEKYLNYLLKAEREGRIKYFSSKLRRNQAIVNSRCKIYLMGSYLRQKIYEDIDLIIVFRYQESTTHIDNTLKIIIDYFKDHPKNLDFTVCTEKEYSQFALAHDNRVQVL